MGRAVRGARAAEGAGNWPCPRCGLEGGAVSGQRGTTNETMCVQGVQQASQGKACTGLRKGYLHAKGHVRLLSMCRAVNNDPHYGHIQ